MLEYMTRLVKVQEKVKDKIFIIPRVYTNKPRTKGVGYKGMLHQPDPEKGEDMLAGKDAGQYLLSPKDMNTLAILPQLIEAGVLPDLIRLSVGIEDVNDIIADLDQALANV